MASVPTYWISSLGGEERRREKIAKERRRQDLRTRREEKRRKSHVKVMAGPEGMSCGIGDEMGRHVSQIRVVLG